MLCLQLWHCRFWQNYPQRKAFLLGFRSEEHTSELQSRPHLVCRLLLEKKKKKKKNINIISQKKIKHLHPSTAILLVCCEHRFIQQQYCSDSLDHDTHINYIT